MSDGSESASFVLTFEGEKRAPLMFRHTEGTLASTPHPPQKRQINQVTKPVEDQAEKGGVQLHAGTCFICSWGRICPGND